MLYVRCFFVFVLNLMNTSSFYFYYFKFLFIYLLFLVALDLQCCLQAFSSRGEQELLFVGVHERLITVVSLLAAQALGVWASVVAA